MADSLKRLTLSVVRSAVDYVFPHHVCQNLQLIPHDTMESMIASGKYKKDDLQGYDCKEALRVSSEMGLFEASIYFIKSGASSESDFILAFSNACKCGQSELVKWLLENKEWECDDLDRMLRVAAGAGHNDVVQQIIMKDIQNYLDIVNDEISPIDKEQFVKNGRLDIVKLVTDCSISIKKLLSIDRCDLNCALYAAAYNNRVSTVELLIHNGATGINTALGKASINGSLSVMKWLILYGTTQSNDTLKLNDILKTAVLDGQLSSVKLLVECGANKINEALDKLCHIVYLSNNKPMYELLIELGATSKGTYQEALDRAMINKRNEEILRWVGYE